MSYLIVCVSTRWLSHAPHLDIVFYQGFLQPIINVFPSWALSYFLRTLIVSFRANTKKLNGDYWLRETFRESSLQRIPLCQDELVFNCKGIRMKAITSSCFTVPPMDKSSAVISSIYISLWIIWNNNHATICWNCQLYVWQQSYRLVSLSNLRCLMNKYVMRIIQLFAGKCT